MCNISGVSFNIFIHHKIVGKEKLTGGLMKPTKKAIRLALQTNTLNAKAIAQLDSDWQYIQAQEELIKLLYEYHSLSQELLDLINTYRREVQQLNEKICNLQRHKTIPS